MGNAAAIVHADQPFPYAQADYEDVPCNLCGSVEKEPVANRDRNRLPVQSVMCRQCGLIYISPRMTAEWYGRYYEIEYRRQMAAYRGNRKPEADEPERIFETQVRRGAWLVRYLRQNGIPPPRSVLEIGSSTGGLLRALADEFGARILGVEPSPEEAEFARARGVPTVTALFEEYQTSDGEEYDLIVCTQSYNHLLNPHGVTERVRECLSTRGTFFLECQNFFHVCRARLAISAAVQIDHVYMFSPRTLRAMLEISGLKVLDSSLIIDSELPDEAIQAQRRALVPCYHVRMLAQADVPASKPSSTFAEEWDALQALPDSPLRAGLQRQWKLAKRRVFKYLSAIRQQFKASDGATTEKSAAKRSHAA